MLISAENISFSYHGGKTANHVLDGVSLSIGRGETVGLSGPSGCGKSTFGQVLCGLRKPSSGSVVYNGERLSYPLKRQVRREIQVLFQHPENSFNPRIKLYKSLKEIYKLFGLPFSEKNLYEMLAPFGLYEEHMHRFPAQLSGGELQRIALARVLLAKPKLIVLDEPTSMLDSISQAQIINMLMKIQEDKKISYLFITHDKLLCAHMSHRMFTMSNKKIVEGNHLT
jgi:ABC-type dipeptide/oligopeptide/nickel transport system ATPase subunit